MVVTEEISAAETHERWNYWTMALYLACYRTGLALVQPDTVLPVALMQLTSNTVLLGLASSLYLFFWTFPQSLSAFYTARATALKPLVSLLMVLHALPWAILGCYFILMYDPERGSHLSNGTAMWLIYAAVVSFSILGGASIPGYMTMVGKTVVGTTRIQMMGYVWCITAVLTFGVAQLMRHLIANVPFPLNFAIVFLLGFAVFCLAIAFWAETREPANPVRRTHETLREYYQDIWDSIRHEPSFRYFTIAMTFAGFSLPLLLPFLAVHAIRDLKYNPETVAYFLLVMTVCQSFAGYVTGRYVARHSASLALLIAFGFMLAASIVLLVMRADQAIWVGYTLTGLAQGFFVSGYQPAMFEVSGRQDVSVVIGITNTIRAPFYALGPILGGVLYERFGFSAVLICSLTASLLAGSMMFPVAYIAGHANGVRA